MKEFEGILAHNLTIKNLDAIVGFLRASGYFTLRPFLDGIDKVRILIGIDVDKYIARAASQVDVGNGLYVITHSNNKMKKSFLDAISKAFNLGWKVVLVK